MKQSFKHLIALIQSDIYRHHGDISWKRFFMLLIQDKGFVATSLYRVTRFFYLNEFWILMILMKIANRIVQEHHQYELPYRCKVGPGFQITHLQGMIIHQDARLGKNQNLSHQITIGAKPGGQSAGVPVLHDNVFVASGARIIGGIIIGNHVAIGANAVVTKSLPDMAVAVGIPAKIISSGGSIDYCWFTDYEDKIEHLPQYDYC